MEKPTRDHFLAESPVTKALATRSRVFVEPNILPPPNAKKLASTPARF